MQQNSYTPAPAPKGQVNQVQPPQKFIIQKQIDGTFRLTCPVCGRLSLESIPWSEASEMGMAGYSSICVDCDPTADTPVPYQLATLVSRKDYQELLNLLSNAVEGVRDAA